MIHIQINEMIYMIYHIIQYIYRKKYEQTFITIHICFYSSSLTGLGYTRVPLAVPAVDAVVTRSEVSSFFMGGEPAARRPGMVKHAPA